MRSAKHDSVECNQYDYADYSPMITITSSDCSRYFCIMESRKRKRVEMTVEDKLKICELVSDKRSLANVAKSWSWEIICS